MSRAEDFKNVISEIFTWTLSHIHERDIKNSIDVELVISIAGTRRSGETFLVYSIISKLERFLPRSSILYTNPEHERHRHLSAEDLGVLITAYYEIGKPDRTRPIYLFLNEIQTVEGWSRWINTIYGFKVYHI